jgi:hypothetical protein
LAQQVRNIRFQADARRPVYAFCIWGSVFINATPHKNTATAKTLNAGACALTWHARC